MSVVECGVGELIMTPDAHCTGPALCSENRKRLEASVRVKILMNEPVRD